MRKSIWQKIRILWVFSGIVFVIWISYSMQAKNVDPGLLTNNDKIAVADNSEYISFTPVQQHKNIFIFLPGAMVDPIAYVPLCRKLAEAGIQTFIIRMPYRQARLGYKKLLKLNILNDKDKTYILAGHSQGAKMAAQFVQENPGKINKLILMGTTHPKDYKLESRGIHVLKIYGTSDGVAREEDVLMNKSNLPAATKFVCIKGGNHSQFGYYGYQLGDHSASVTREEQQKIILESVLFFINY